MNGRAPRAFSTGVHVKRKSLPVAIHIVDSHSTSSFLVVLSAIAKEINGMAYAQKVAKKKGGQSVHTHALRDTPPRIATSYFVDAAFMIGQPSTRLRKLPQRPYDDVKKRKNLWLKARKVPS